MTYGLEPLDDRDLRDSLRSGMSFPAALEDLRRRLVRYAVKLVWNRADAEEIVQDAFQIAVTKKIAIRDDQFDAWMFRTAGNLCLNHRRKHRPESLGDWIAASEARTPIESAMEVERLERLRVCISELPPQQRIALTLRWIEQFDYRDVAKIMELTESAARAHVHQARRHLADAMGSHDDA
ncbi:MAG: RNA polymerase sigma factor [Phycisphaerales bacterium]|nr:RNA polymerase sigma factor [Phycisphaerales bacterium]MCB9855605.1 RNA polymerase sigma factor [Phycisphaerales bacterium]MCB9864906.1 RNA polymerase sigma factor [Phycisphaerales bacterium]